jgi:hypothetical protein
MVDTLCHPGDDKSCFRCCPPIRVSDYDHLDYRAFLSRELRENTLEFRSKGPSFRPIRGFTCWALGYLDPRGRKIGCLLHPFRNQGNDLRHLIDYGEKCRIATCREARIFLRLSPRQREFYHALCRGMDSFEYSSPKVNPLFTILPWGALVSGEIAELEGRVTRDVPLMHKYPFLKLTGATGLRYLVERTLAQTGVEALRGAGFARRLESSAAWCAARLPLPAEVSSEAIPTHRLEIDRACADFLRLRAGLKRLDLDTALKLKKRLDDLIDTHFMDGRRGSREGVA